MNQIIAPEPVRKSLLVRADPTRAFEVFTSGIGSWWLKAHSTTASGQVNVVIEPRAGGRWFELGASGEICDWGYVRAWEPPKRLVLVWQLNADWRFDPALDTEVEVVFEPEGAGATRVTLEHRGLENFGTAATAMRHSLDSSSGWAGLLEAFAAGICG